jgi:single-strand DNA-binding protein
MAKGLNKIQIIGNLGSDPDMKFSPGGSPLTTFSVAVNRSHRGPDGQTTEETDWFRVVCWNKLAEVADQYLKKGARLRRGTIADPEVRCHWRRAVEIVASDLLMLSGRDEARELVQAGSGQAEESMSCRSRETYGRQR